MKTFVLEQHVLLNSQYPIGFVRAKDFEQAAEKIGMRIDLVPPEKFEHLRNLVRVIDKDSRHYNLVEVEELHSLSDVKPK